MVLSYLATFLLPSWMFNGSISLVVVFCPALAATGAARACRQRISGATQAASASRQMLAALVCFWLLFVAFQLVVARVLVAVTAAMWRCGPPWQLPAALFMDVDVLQHVLLITLSSEVWDFDQEVVLSLGSAARWQAQVQSRCLSMCWWHRQLAVPYSSPPDPHFLPPGKHR